VSSHYTDVDRLILERWNEVLELQGAFKGLAGRIQDNIDGALTRAARWLDEQGYRCEWDAKTPEISAWKLAWEAKRGLPAVRLTIGEFAPFGYGRIRGEHPYLWVYTHNLDGLKLKEPERVQFGRDLRASIGEALATWDDDEASDSESPLGRYVTALTDAKRVELVANPQQLIDFVQSGFTQLFELSSAVDAQLAARRAR
jgi:hypothetical protein